MPSAARGELWLIDFDPTRGHEQAGRRTALVISDDRFNQGSAGLVLVIPLTTRERGIPTQVVVSPPEGGVRTRSFLKCEDLRSVSNERLVHGPLGRLTPGTIAAVEDRLRLHLSL